MDAGTQTNTKQRTVSRMLAAMETQVACRLGRRCSALKKTPIMTTFEATCRTSHGPLSLPHKPANAAKAPAEIANVDMLSCPQPQMPAANVHARPPTTIDYGSASTVSSHSMMRLFCRLALVFMMRM